MTVLAHWPEAEEVGQILRAMRTVTGMSLMKTGETFGQHFNSLARWERGSGASALKYALALARYDEEPRDELIRYLGGPVLEESDDPPELRRWIDTVRSAYASGNPAARQLMSGIDGVLRAGQGPGRPG